MAGFDAREAYRKIADEANKRQVAAYDGYDKSILALATTFLGFSIGILKDFKTSTYATPWLIISWWLFLLGMV